VRPGETIRGACLSLLLTAAVICVSLPAAPAPAASSLRFLGCVTGKLPPTKRPRAPKPGGCKTTRTALLDSEGSAMNHLLGLTASPDGRSLYALSSREDAIAAFGVKPLGFRECVSGIVGLGPKGTKACSLFPHAGTEDATTGFNGVRFATVSPDGRSVYTVSADNAIGIFARSPKTGKLTYRSCLTGGKGPNSASEDGACGTIPTATRAYDGLDSGLGGIASLTVSPDSRFVYVAASGDAAVTTLVRAANGSLGFRDCVAGGTRSLVGLASPCAVLPLSADNPHWSGLKAVSRIAISRDGRSLYTSAPKTSSIAEFRRDPTTGALAYAGCITGDYGRGTGPGDPCLPIPTYQEAGFDSGMWLIKQMAISRDGRSLYGLAGGDHSVVSFSRDPASGTLTYRGCLTGNSELAQYDGVGKNPCAPLPGAKPRAEGSGFARPTDLTLDPSGHYLLVASGKDAAITQLARNPTSGALTYRGCLTANPTAARPAGPCALVRGRGGAHQLGFGGLDSLAFARGRLYAAAGAQAAISSFSLGG
jgi:6-phosphogluconolactonase (cycloisomerase 2 family)